MLNISDFLSSPETTKDLLERCYDFRGAVLLNPDEFALAAKQRNMTVAPGWGIRTVLTADEVEELYGDRASKVRLSVQELLPGLPCLTLDVPCRRRHFLWVIPFWEEGALDWMKTLAAEGRFTLMVDAQGDTRSIAMSSRAPLDDDFETVLKTIQVQPMASKLESLEAMVISGFRAMLDRASNPQEPQRELRTMVVARDGHAQPVLETFLRSADIGAVLMKMAERGQPVYH